MFNLLAITCCFHNQLLRGAAIFVFSKTVGILDPNDLSAIKGEEGPTLNGAIHEKLPLFLEHFPNYMNTVVHFNNHLINFYNMSQTFQTFISELLSIYNN